MDNTAPPPEHILNRHLESIQKIVYTCLEKDHIALVEILEPLKAEGWVSLSEAVVKIFEGERDIHAFDDMQRDERLVIQAIFNGLEDPSKLQEEEHNLDNALTIPHLLTVINDARSGQQSALDYIDKLRDHLEQQDGSKPRLGKALSRLARGRSLRGELDKYHLDAEDSLFLQALMMKMGYNPE